MVRGCNERKKNISTETPVNIKDKIYYWNALKCVWLVFRDQKNVRDFLIMCVCLTVVGSVCSKTDHTLDSVTIKVATYHRELGLPDECEATRGAKTCSFTFDVESDDQYKVKYFKKQPEMQVKLNEQLFQFLIC